MSSRFVAGTRIEDALEVTRTLNLQGISVTLDSLGENVSSSEDAQKAAEVYHRLLDRIAAAKLDANISVKLTHIGFDMDPDVAFGFVAGLAEHARKADSFIRIDMEGSRYTQATIDLVRRLHDLPENRGRIGVVIQAYLYRSRADISSLLESGIRIRLCKGAYQEPPNIAFAKKASVDANYVELMKMLLTSGVYHGIATHDPKIIAVTREFARARKIPAQSFEFQMLYGVRRDLQRTLVKQGNRLRLYVPFGTEWYPYFMRRLAERPANLLFLLRNLV